MSDDRRTAQRFTRRLKVRIGSLELVTTNVSSTGTQLACPQTALVRFPVRHQGEEFDSQILLPDGSQLAVRSEVAYISDYDEEYLIGVHFRAFEADGAALWQKYVALAPAR